MMGLEIKINYLTVQLAGKVLLLRCENKHSPVLGPHIGDRVTR